MHYIKEGIQLSFLGVLSVLSINKTISKNGHTSFVHHTYFDLVTQHYGKKKSVIVQTSKVKAYFFHWDILGLFGVAQILCLVQQGFWLPVWACPRCWNPSASRAGLLGTLLCTGELLCACQIQSCWQEGADSDLDLSFTTRDLYNLMEKEQFLHASLK